MKYCRHCGTEMKDEANVCVNCGCSVNTPVTSEVAYCKSCGAEMNSKATVCLKCGVEQGKTNPAVSSLKRSADGKIIAGVCAGLGKNWNLNPWVIRIVLIVTNFFVIGWLLDIVYIIMCFVLPMED